MAVCGPAGEQGSCGDGKPQAAPGVPGEGPGQDRGRPGEGSWQARGRPGAGPQQDRGRPAPGRAPRSAERPGVCIRGEVADILTTMRDVSSPVLDPADAGRGMLHALQALLLGLILLVIL